MMINNVAFTKTNKRSSYKDNLIEKDLLTSPALFEGCLRQKLDQINYVFENEEVCRIKRNGKLPILLNIPPSTLGYFKGECLVSIDQSPMTRSELLNLATKETYFEDKKTLSNKDKGYIAVGYMLVEEDELDRNRPFKSYIVPIKQCSPSFSPCSSTYHMNPSRKGEQRFCPNPHWLPYFPWVIFAKRTLERHPKLPLPSTIAANILSYFKWGQDWDEMMNQENQNDTQMFDENKSVKRQKISEVSYESFLHPPLRVPRDYIATIKDKDEYINYVGGIDQYNQTGLQKILKHTEKVYSGWDALANSGWNI